MVFYQSPRICSSRNFLLSNSHDLQASILSKCAYWTQKASNSRNSLTRRNLRMPYSPTLGDSKRSPFKISKTCMRMGGAALLLIRLLWKQVTRRLRDAVTRLCVTDFTGYRWTHVALINPAAQNYLKPSIPCSRGTRSRKSVMHSWLIWRMQKKIRRHPIPRFARVNGLRENGHFRSY